MGILFPPAILWLDFKSKEELQLMPQTMEEHLDELESEASDADISFSLNDEHDVSLFTLVVIKEANFVMNINETNHNIGNYRFYFKLILYYFYLNCVIFIGINILADPNVCTFLICHHL